MTSGVGQKTTVLHMAMGDICERTSITQPYCLAPYLETVLHPIQRPLPLPSVQKASCFVSSVSVLFLDKNQTCIGSFLPFIETGPLYSRWN